MPDLLTSILNAVSAKSYTPIKAKPLFKRLNLSENMYPEFRKTLRELVRNGRLAVGGNNTIRAADVHGSVVGTYRRSKAGHGFVRPAPIDGFPQTDIYVREDKTADASTGDTVMVRVTRAASKLKDPAGEIVRVLERATRAFVGTYFERDGEGLVRVDGTVFAHSIAVGDPGAKGAKPQDKVVVELLRFPSGNERGEGVITEVLGPHGTPGVDTISVIKAFGLPEEFPEAALAEARQVAAEFAALEEPTLPSPESPGTGVPGSSEGRRPTIHGREDFTGDTVITIDPVDARDFDDAVSVVIDPKSKHWVLTVHIADVGAFAKAGGALDAEARRRATSVYLPQKVIPMFPEIISNGLASLQEGKLRFVKTVQIEFTPGLQKANVRFANGAIKTKKRFAYEEVRDILNALTDGTPVPDLDAEVLALIKRMRDLALLLRKKRLKRGALELSMPEAVLEYDTDGRVSGAHFAVNDLSHQIIEEFMLAANEAVAEHFTNLGVPLLRRVHPAPNEEKLDAFAGFAEMLGYPIRRTQDRFELQRVLNETADKPERAAVHFALLRSLKQATYSPIQDEHYALAMPHYCHFTSPIRRYPDLVTHRMLDRWIKTGKAAANVEELTALGDHCSKMERRAETAERELVKLKLLTYLSTRLGEQLDAVITGVADYGFFAQAEKIPAEGLVHISSLVDDYYWFDEHGHALEGKRTKRRFRLGDRVKVEVGRVDVQRRMLDFRLVTDAPPPPKKVGKVPPDAAPPSYVKGPKKEKKGKRRKG